MRQQQRISNFIRFSLTVWFVSFLACSGDNPVANKINHRPPPPPSNSNYAEVESAKLKIDQPDYVGPCPHAFQLTGKITTKGPGIVNYQFRDDDAMWTQGGTLEFKSAETKKVTATTYSFNMSTKYDFGLEILGPKSLLDFKFVSVTCE